MYAKGCDIFHKYAKGCGSCIVLPMGILNAKGFSIGNAKGSGIGSV